MHETFIKLFLIIFAIIMIYIKHYLISLRPNTDRGYQRSDTEVLNKDEISEIELD